MLQMIFHTAFAGYFTSVRGTVPGLAGWRRGHQRRLRAI